MAAYIKTCHICQVTGKLKQVSKPAPLQPVTVEAAPFEYLQMDCVGPLPLSKNGCWFLLTIMCQVTRYPAAYPLRAITTRSVVKALSQFFSIFSIPKVVQTYQGSNFMSRFFLRSYVSFISNITHPLLITLRARVPLEFPPNVEVSASCLLYGVRMGGEWEEGLPWLLLASREVKPCAREHRV